MQLRLFNTLTRKKEVFKPLIAKRAGIYTCGPTVYARAHIGNLRSYLFPDLLKRVLGALGLEVCHVINITDVGHLISDADEGEDKVERAARANECSAWEIAQEYTDYFLQDIKQLSIQLPDHLPRATEHITEQIDLIRNLEAKGFTYRTSDGIYYHARNFADYGRLARLDLKGLRSGVRIEVHGKKGKSDFALWKFTAEGVKRQMEWDSPWGRGFPGWHVECSAMSMKYLGETFDIHTGGSDHIPVHHTNEIAQSEAATGKRFVNYWMHGAFLVLKEGRMGKSEGNMLSLDSLLAEEIEPLAFRYLAFNNHYRQYLQFSWSALRAAESALMHMRYLVRTAFQQINQPAVPTLSSPADDLQQSIMEVLCDDLNSPRALGLLWQAMRDDSLEAQKKCDLVAWVEPLLGLGLLDFSRLRAAETDFQTIPDEVKSLADARQQAREQRKWQQADDLRKTLLEAGYAVEDNPNGYKLERLK